MIIFSTFFYPSLLIHLCVNQYIIKNSRWTSHQINLESTFFGITQKFLHNALISGNLCHRWCIRAFCFCLRIHPWKCMVNLPFLPLMPGWNSNIDLPLNETERTFVNTRLKELAKTNLSCAKYAKGCSFLPKTTAGLRWLENGVQVKCWHEEGRAFFFFF